MKNFFFFCLGSAPFMAFAASGFTAGNIGTTNYSFNPDTIFPSPRKLSTDKGVDNIIDYATNMVGPVTTLMAIGATLMIILGGFYMVMGGADSEQTEKGKWVIKDALVGMVLGLMAYVIIVTLWNILDI